MRLLLNIVAIATIPAGLGVNVNSAAAQDLFNDRWSIIPKAHAEPAPAAPDQTRQDAQEQATIGKQPANSHSNHRKITQLHEPTIEFFPAKHHSIPTRRVKPRAESPSIEMR